MAEQYIVAEHEYLRPNKKFPSVWCPGCGIGIVMGALIRAIGGLELDKDNVALVSGIGCTGRMPVYMDFDSIHTTHGRALAFATGLKLAKPDMKVIVVMGDGDALAIGGNHFIHAARRNIDLTTLVVNNFTYGLTSGQASPTTPTGAFTTTSRYGHLEQPADIAALAEAAGASFVARSTVYHALELEKLIRRGIEKKGFAVIEAISHCHVHFGRHNARPTAAENLQWQRDMSISAAAAKARPEQAQGKIIRGVLVDRELPEFVDQYRAMVTRLQSPPATLKGNGHAAQEPKEATREEKRL